LAWRPETISTLEEYCKSGRFSDASCSQNIILAQPSTTEGILRKLQKVMNLTQKWKDFEDNVTT
jgi:hypothetical protein